MYRTVTPFILALSLFHTSTSDYTRMVEKVEASTVRIESIEEKGTGTCTGFVVAVHEVLTANHCVAEIMSVDGIAVSAGKVDAVNDLALVYVDTNKVPLKLRDAPVVRFEMVTSIGYAYGLHALMVLLNRVLMVDGDLEDGNAPKGIIVSPGYIGGMSGGPVVDAKGYVVGIVQRGSAQIGYGVSAAAIRAFIGA